MRIGHGCLTRADYWAALGLLSPRCIRHKSSLSAVHEGLRQTEWQDKGYRSQDRRRFPAYDPPNGTQRAIDGPSKYDRKAKGSLSSKRQTPTDHVSIPYTTAASEWIYGINPVLAALRARKRTLYKCYAHRSLLGSSSDRGREVERLASELDCLNRVGDDFLPVMEQVAQGRPHNGVVLEVSAIRFDTVVGLGRPHSITGAIPLLNRSPANVNEDNPASNTLKLANLGRSNTWRHPLVVFLDGITDPGNLGNILRTAHFYRADAVAISVNTCAPINNPIVVKASSGAIEGLNLLAVDGPAQFARSAREHGWEVLAAVAPSPYQSANDARGSATMRRRQLVTSTMVSPLAQKPCLLMLGSEGEGLRENLKSKATVEIVIAGGSGSGDADTTDIGLDSLNVGAAAAALLEALSRRPTHDTRSRYTQSR